MTRSGTLIFALLCQLAGLVSASDSDLVGRWSYEVDGEAGEIQFDADGRAVFDGEVMQYEAAAGQLVLRTQGIELPASHQVQGDRMIMDLVGERTEYTRIGSASVAPRPAPRAPAPVAAPSTLKSPLPADSGPSKPGTMRSTPASDGRWFRLPDQGFEIRLPGDFELLRAEGGGYLIGSNTIPGVVLVYANPQLTEAEIEQGARDGYADDTMALTPTGAAISLQAGEGRGKRVPVSGTLDGQSVQGYLAGYTTGRGAGLTLAALTTPDSWPQLEAHAATMSSDVRLYTPEVSPKLQQARQSLAGNSLVWASNSSNVSMNSDGYYTGSAVNAFEAWHCCAGGRGRYEGSRATSMQGAGIFGGSDSGQGAFDGQWSLDAQGDDYLLTFRFDDGSSQSWQVRVDANENVYVDGRRVQVKQDSICQ